MQCSAKALEKREQMTHTIEKYGDICNFSGVTSVILPFLNLKCVATLAATVKIIGYIPNCNVLNVSKMQPRHNPGHVSWRLGPAGYNEQEQETKATYCGQPTASCINNQNIIDHNTLQLREPEIE